MKDRIQLLIGDDGKAKLYDDTYDITIHCESEEEQAAVIAKLKSMEWISVSERLPEEDEYVLICFEDDPKEKWYCRMAVGWLEDGFWQCWDDRANTRKDVVAWMPLPEPYKEGDAE